MTDPGQVGPLRPWTDADDVTALARLLHASYKPLLDAGMRYLTGRQRRHDTAPQYRLVGEADWDVTNYRSVVLSKSIP